MVWITSVMTYWYPGVLEAVRIEGEIFPGVQVVARRHICHALSRPCQTARRGRPRRCRGDLRPAENDLRYYRFPVRNANIWADFAAWPSPALDLSNTGPDYAPILTGAGCPHRCPFCASATLQPKRARFGAERIFEQIAGDIMKSG